MYQRPQQPNQQSTICCTNGICLKQRPSLIKLTQLIILLKNMFYRVCGSLLLSLSVWDQHFLSLSCRSDHVCLGLTDTNVCPRIINLEFRQMNNCNYCYTLSLLIVIIASSRRWCRSSGLFYLRSSHTDEDQQKRQQFVQSILYL